MSYKVVLDTPGKRIEKLAQQVITLAERYREGVETGMSPDVKVSDLLKDRKQGSLHKWRSNRRHENGQGEAKRRTLV